MISLATATAAICALLIASPFLYWVGCHRFVESNAALTAGLQLLRTSSIVGGFIYLRIFYVRRLPTSFAGLAAWTSPIASLNVLGAVLLAAGQFLNVLAYRTLGVKGVYYGYEYGILPPDPSISERFPFNTLDHPMYTGGILTALGILALTALDRKDRSVRWPVVLIAVVTIGSFVAGMIIEQPGKCVDPLNKPLSTQESLVKIAYN